MIFVLVLGKDLKSILSTSKGTKPFKTLPSSPCVQSTVISIPVFISCVATSVPTIQGIPSSLETIAAWQVLPPLSVTIAPAFFIIGSQSGSVIIVTKTSPSSN